MSVPGWNLLGASLLDAGAEAVTRSSRLFTSDLIWVVATGFGLFLILLLWAVYLRQPKRRRTRKSAKRKVYREKSAEPEGTDGEEGAEEREARKRYKYRYRRREHRLRNPTLAQTGGLASSNDAKAGGPPVSKDQQGPAIRDS